MALLSIVALRVLGVCEAPACEGPLALERGSRDGTPPAHEIRHAGLLSATVHQALTRAEHRCGVVDVLSCGRHADLLSRP